MTTFLKCKKWGKKYCRICQKLSFLGIPEGWHLLAIEGVGNTDPIKDIIPALSQDITPRIHLHRGIRLSKGNQFFFYAPPFFSITGATTNTLFYSIEKEIQGKLIQCEEYFYLPKNVPSQKQIIISYRDNVHLKSKSTILESPKFFALKTH